jgi:hypothetical protein
VERELVLRLASLLWRLRRATAMETGLFEIQAEHLLGFKPAIHPTSRDVVYALFGRTDSVSFDRDPESQGYHQWNRSCAQLRAEVYRDYR